MLADRTVFEEQVAVLEALQRAFERRDAAALAELVHPDATLRLITAPEGGDVRGRDGALDYMDDVERRLIVPAFHSIEPAGNDAVLVIGRIQYQHADNSLTDTTAVWLVQFRDGLIWQTDTFTNEADARAQAALLSPPG